MTASIKADHVDSRPTLISITGAITMKNIMHKSVISLAVAMLVTAGFAHAERNPHRGSYVADTTRTTAQGTFTRHTEQVATDNGFTRATSVTDPAGKTATHNVSVVNDKDGKTHSRDVSGTTYAGKSYSASSVTQKTDDGYTRTGSATGADGKTASRDVTFVADKTAGTATKTIETTGPNGKSNTVVKQITKTGSSSVQ